MINFSDILYIFFILIILLGLMYSLLYLMRRFLYKQGGKSYGSVNMQVLSTHPIMPKKFLSVVKVQNKYFLLGISENSLNLIDKLDDFDESELNYKDHSAKGLSFFNHLKNNMTGK